MAKENSHNPYEEIGMLLNDDLHIPSKTIFCMDEDDDKGITSQLAKKFIKSLFILDMFKADGDNSIKVYLSTCGGDVDAGMAIYDAIKNCKSKVHIVGIGPVYSMGSRILQAGSYRSLTKNAKVMWHDGEIGMGGTPQQVNAINADSERDRKFSYKILEEKLFEVVKDENLPAEVKARMRKHNIKIKGKGFTLKEIELIFSIDIYFNAEEALRMNFIDEII